MARNLIGTFTDPDGTALSGWGLVLTAKTSQPPSLPAGARETITLDSAGGYSINILDGLYSVSLANPINGAVTQLGSITVTAGAPVDVLTLLGITAVLPSAAETVVDAAIAAHESAADPHTGYQKESEKGAASGYASLDAGGTVPDAQIPAGIARDTELAAAVAASEAGQVRDGDAAGGVLSGTYPNPGFAADMATQAELDAEAALARNADNLTSGTVADARIPATIARDADVAQAVSDHESAADPHPVYTTAGEANAVAWSAGPPAVAFASLPAASAVPQAVYQVIDANDSFWRSNGTIWKPLNGRAVLANYNTPDLTVQSTSDTILATLSFPGGLITSGMRLLLDLKYNTPGIGTAGRFVRARIGASGSSMIGVLATQVTNGYSNVSGAFIANRTLNYLLVKSSTSAAHVGTPNSSIGVFTNVASEYNPTIDFSADWDLQLTGQSCNETAINITAASWAAGVATFTATAHTLAVGNKTTIAGVNPAGYNGVVVVTSVADANTFTAEIAADPGVYVSGGTSSRISNVTLQSYILEVIG
jgi:hypothetical protein